MDNHYDDHTIDPIAQAQLQTEASFLGAMILQNDLIDDCYIEPNELVTSELHPFILECILYAYEQYNEVDVVVLAQVVREVGDDRDFGRMGGIVYISDITSSVLNLDSFSFEFYQAKIREAYVARTAKVKLNSLALNIDQQGVTSALQRVQVELDTLHEMMPQKRNNGMTRASAALKEHVEVVNERSLSDGKPEIPSISPKKDALTNGHQLGDLEIVGARPSMGKTAYAIDEAKAILFPGDTAVAFFSLEMPYKQLLDRFISGIGNIDQNSLKRGNLDFEEWERYHMSVSILNKQHLYFDDTTSLTVEGVKRKVKRLKKELEKVGITKLVVIIDYLQLLESEKKFNSTNDRVSHISRSLKKMALELEVKVKALSQLSREVDKRHDKRPMLSDLRDSGSVEQDADLVTFLYRDDYYNKDSEKKGITEIIIAKQRNGPVGSVEMMFLKQFSKFVEVDTQRTGSDS